MSELGLYGAATWRASDGAPKPALLPPMLRRRTSVLTRAVALTLEQVAEPSGADISRAALVHASALGEISVTVNLLHMMREGDGALSPTRFHNSVHNTATGYVSIAAGNRGFATAVAAGAATVAAGLFEAAGLVHAGQPQVLLALADEPPPAPLSAEGAPPYEALCVALHLGPPAGAPARLSVPREAPSGPPGPSLEPTPELAGEVAPELAGNPCAPAWALAQAFRARAPGTFPAQRPVAGAPAWVTRLTFPP